MDEITFKKSKPEASPKTRLVGKVFQKNEDKWEPFAWDRLLNVPLADVLSGNLRMICEVWVDGKRHFIASHTEDEESLHKKHPSVCIVNLDQLYKFLLKCAKDEKWIEWVPKVMMCLNTFEGAEVIS